ncbi:hypothetical protein SDC9_160841 [bioreactor metagenome]|uniref:Flagellar basal-body/hook protein C-terminal domain-containing protein n=1 Tax=bioreactor metagenome TaxID=1076179 RepID=A0A645FHT3_9ZZZZ
MEVLNGKGCYAASGENSYRGVLYYKSALDDFAKAFANTINTLNGVGKPLFDGTAAKDITISDDWIADANYITASQIGGNNGANDNILKMISAMDSITGVSPYFNGTFGDYTLSLMSDVGIDLDYKNVMSKSSNLVLASISNQRESIMGVSLNEETASLLQYQKAFEASSRFMTTLDEALDVIINRMGVVGR